MRKRLYNLRNYIQQQIQQDKTNHLDKYLKEEDQEQILEVIVK